VTDGHQFGARPGAVQDRLRHECVVEDRIGGLQQSRGPHRQQLGVARSGPDEVHAGLSAGASPRRLATLDVESGAMVAGAVRHRA